MKSTQKIVPYKIYIDTGGTFTDCIAITPGGGTKRCKVLSSSKLRGYARAGNFNNQVHWKPGFKLKNNFFKGYQFRLLEESHQTFTITQSDEESGILTLDHKIDVLKDHQQFSFEIESPEEAPLLAARIITNTSLHEILPAVQMRLSTTKGTNALLEREGGKTLFLITEGFKDLLHIKNQQRSELFCLDIRKAEPFYRHIVEVPERLDAVGKIIKTLDLEILKNRIEPLLSEIEAAGICLMHSYLNPDHEKQVEELLLELGVPFVSRSSALSPSIKIVNRAVTTDVNAYLTPPMQNYLNSISNVIGNSSLRIMSSAGSLIEAKNYTPKDGLFSGPAGGVIGAVAVAKRAALNGETQKIISFDMGGTSTDVSRFDGETDYIFEHTVGDATLSAPAIDIETVAAGGGSICDFDGKSLTVGPGSAGADPGPACYGRGGPLTITDVNLLSGRLHPSNFQIVVHPKASEEVFLQLMEKINQDKKNPLSKDDVLSGFLDIANERMAQAIRKISIQKGFNPVEYALVAFGGAGGQHALSVAAKLNIQTVLVPSDAGLLSAYGLQQAKPEQIASRQVLKLLKDVKPKLTGWFDTLSNEGKAGLMNQGIDKDNIQITRKQLHLRLKGQDSSLQIDWTNPDLIEGHFKKAYEEQYGHWLDGRDIEVEIIRVIAAEKSIQESIQAEESNMKTDRNVPKVTDSPSGSGEHPSWPKPNSPQGEIQKREDLKPGTILKGPALILDPHSTTVIETGWEGNLLDDGTWVIKDIRGMPDKSLIEQSKRFTGSQETDRPEAVQLQLFTNRFRSVADQMGEMLQRTAISVNVKERLDFSCAILDPDGFLVVNAPHIPVHLGAMGTCVRMVLNHLKESPTAIRDLTGFQNLSGLEEGDVIITNHPGFGGSHLPDITVITPVFYEGKLIGFAANRAHHAEIGGTRPGSMPPDANTLAEEGVVIPPAYIAKKGKFNWKAIRDLLEKDTWPTRAIEENMADLRAAVSANHRGVTELKKMCDAYSPEEVLSYMNKLKKYASDRMKLSLINIKDGTYAAEEKLDDGSVLNVACTVDGDSMTIDFTGTSDVHPGNLNANPSIVNSVIIYVLRLIVNEPLPLNDGLLEPVNIILPKGMLSPDFPADPAECPAVVGGNIETSQRLTDTLLKAFSLASCSYGTMNNVLFGNDRFGYYETVAGGTGAGEGFHGADAVHQHMTNTRAADPEILEHRYPVRLNRYSIREKSGGNGKWKGGNGLIRELTFLEPVSLSVLTQHRIVAPYGLNGGENGNCGRQRIIRKTGKEIELYWRDGAELKPGDTFILETPGGGGFGTV